MSVRWSVVIPTYRRPDQIARALKALADISAPDGGYEIVVVDDGGGIDLSPALCAPNMRLITQANTGPAGARNRGADEARGTYLAFTDDDCMPGKGWLVAFDEAVGMHGDALLGGTTVNGLVGNRYSEASQFLAAGFEEFEARDGVERFFASNNIAMAKQHFQAVGGFDTDFPLAAGEDRALCDSWRRFGRPLRRVPNAMVHHFHTLSFKGYICQHYNYGRGAVLVYDRRKISERQTPTIEGQGSFYQFMLRKIRQSRSGTSYLNAAALFAISQIATTLGFLRQRWSKAR